MQKFFLAIVVVAGVAAGTYLYMQRPAVVQAPSGKLSSEEGTFVIADLGVRLTRGDVLTAIELRPTSVQSVGSTVRVSTRSTNSEQGCELGVFYKIPIDGVAQARTQWTVESLQAATESRDGVPAQVKQFADFYLVFEPSQATCSNEDDKKAIEAAERGALWAALSSAEVVESNIPVEAHVRAHISELSQTSALLGGTFYVTHVWAGDGVGVVSYEDGHIGLTADFTYTVSNNIITIDSFVIREN